MRKFGTLNLFLSKDQDDIHIALSFVLLNYLFLSLAIT